jgi:hypothetical protein
MRPSLRLAALLLLLASLSFALVACGGDDKEDFVNEGNDICKEANEKVDDIDEPQNVDEVDEYADEILEVGEDTKSQFEDLDPPDEFQDDFDAYLDNVDEGLELIEELRDAGEAGDEARVEEILEGDELQDLDDEQEELARDMDLDDCAQD